MALSREKYRRIPDLYTAGTELVLQEGTVMYMAVLNPLERDEAQHDAQVARARLIMALKSEHGSDERVKVEAAFFTDGRDKAIERLVAVRVQEHVVESVSAIQSDPDWIEKLEVMQRSEDLLARVPEDAERKLLEQINREYLEEFGRRQGDEQAFLEGKFGDLDDAGLIEEYVEMYVERRGNDVALAEYNLTEVWYAARVCEGVQIGPGQWDHDGCEHHQLRVYEAKAEVRSLPEDLQNLMGEAMITLNMSVRDARFSDRQGSSSDSSPLPSAPAASTASTQTETPAELPGPSTPPSGTH